MSITRSIGGDACGALGAAKEPPAGDTGRWIAAARGTVGHVLRVCAGDDVRIGVGRGSDAQRHITEPMTGLQPVDAFPTSERVCECPAVRPDGALTVRGVRVSQPEAAIAVVTDGSGPQPA